jgi:hypothetical protein
VVVVSQLHNHKLGVASAFRSMCLSTFFAVI